MAKPQENSELLDGLRRRHAELALNMKRLREGAPRAGLGAPSNPQHLELLSFEAAVLGSRMRSLEDTAKTHPR